MGWGSFDGTIIDRRGGRLVLWEHMAFRGESVSRDLQTGFVHLHVVQPRIGSLDISMVSMGVDIFAKVGRAGSYRMLQYIKHFHDDLKIWSSIFVAYELIFPSLEPFIVHLPGVHCTSVTTAPLNTPSWNCSLLAPSDPTIYLILSPGGVQ